MHNFVNLTFFKGFEKRRIDGNYGFRKAQVPERWFYKVFYVQGCYHFLLSAKAARAPPQTQEIRPEQNNIEPIFCFLALYFLFWPPPVLRGLAGPE